MDGIQKITKILTEAQSDSPKFWENGNDAAAGRLRKALLEITKIAKEERATIQSQREENRAKKK